jgi:hypothetical protein
VRERIEEVMKMRLGACILVGGLSLATVVEAIPVDGPKIAGHLVAYTPSKVCASAPKPPCNPGSDELVVAGNTLEPYNVYLLVVDADPGDGVRGASFGIKYDQSPQSGIDVFSWILCAQNEYAGGPTGVTWPASGSGNVIVWDSCQSTSAQGDLNGGVTAVLGSLYVYAYGPDIFELDRRTFAVDPDFSIALCDTSEMQLLFPGAAGKVSFGMPGGLNPCK